MQVVRRRYNGGVRPMKQYGDLNLRNCCCMELMSEYEDNHFDLAICDPPYGGNDAIGLSDCKSKDKQATNRTDYKVFDNTEPTVEYWNELKRVSKHRIIWGVNFYKNSTFDGGRLCWDKHGTAFGRAELAYLSMTKSVNIVDVEWNGMIQHDMKNKEHRIHPTQKPVALYKWLLQNYAKEGDKILDTHLGSGSIAIACYYMGFDLVGSELDEDYYKAMMERIDKETREQELF